MARVKLLDNHKPDRVAGIITRLQTVGENLEIDAELNLAVSYARDLHAIAKQNDGCWFLFGGFRAVKDSSRREHLIVNRGDLREVSVVTFPACVEATMSIVKSAPKAITLDPVGVNALMAQTYQSSPKGLSGRRSHGSRSFCVASGQDHIRKALRHRRQAMPMLAKSVDCGDAALDAFIHGNAILPVPVLRALAKELLNGDYDAASDKVQLTGGVYTAAIA